MGRTKWRRENKTTIVLVPVCPKKKLKQWNAQKSQVQIALNDLTSLRLDIQEENAQRKTATLHNQPHVPFFILQNPTPLVRILLVLQEEEGDKLVVKNKGY